MTPLRRVSGNQYLHHKSDAYRNAVRRKIATYHRCIQLGLIAQGLLQTLSATKPTLIWQSFGSWIRTVRPGLAPSEQVVAIALHNSRPEFLASAAKPAIRVKFIQDRDEVHSYLREGSQFLEGLRPRPSWCDYTYGFSRGSGTTYPRSSRVSSGGAARRRLSNPRSFHLRRRSRSRPHSLTSAVGAAGPDFTWNCGIPCNSRATFLGTHSQFLAEAERWAWPPP